MDQPLAVYIVQRLRNLFHIGQDDGKRKLVSTRQRSEGSIGHHQKGNSLLIHVVIQKLDNVRMIEACYNIGFIAELLLVLPFQGKSKYLDGSLLFLSQVNMFPKIDLSKTSLPQETNQLIVS